VNHGRKTWLGVTTAAVLSACSFAPVYKVPETPPAPAEYKESAEWKIARPQDAEPRGSWWTLFQDSNLDVLQAEVRDSNQTLKAALARMQQARDDTRIARADLFPSLTAAGSFTRAQASPYSPRFPPGARTLGNEYDLEGDFSYELDFWGRIRNQVASAKANQQASAADLATIDLSIRAELAMDYFNLRSYDQQQILLDTTVDDYVQAVELTQNLFDGGAAALTDVAQAQAQLQTARTQAADVRLLRAQTEHAIAVLIGENPSAFHLEPNPLPLDAGPPAIDPGIPSALLERRPDVAEAERRVAAANAQIGVARAAYFPQVVFSGSAGWDSINRAVFLDAPSHFWQFGPQITVPIFEGGRLVAQTDRAKAVYAEQVANYRNTVLTAYQNVEDNIAALRQLEVESRTEAAAVLATEVALQQARFRYSEGQATYLEVATTETAALQAQLSANTIQARRMSTSVLLIKALGGGWQ
jgi:NodT family efflux transporter outer membrane factor (OMF) lipoprotein